jgi:hypothetical protein
MKQLLADFPDHQPFIAKIDIEGAEQDVFSGDTRWVERFPVLILEPHDYLCPGEGTLLPFLRAIAPLKRDLAIMGEHLVSINYEGLKNA